MRLRRTTVWWIKINRPEPIPVEELEKILAKRGRVIRAATAEETRTELRRRGRRPASRFNIFALGSMIRRRGGECGAMFELSSITPLRAQLVQVDELVLNESTLLAMVVRA